MIVSLYKGSKVKLGIRLMRNLETIRSLFLSHKEMYIFFNKDHFSIAMSKIRRRNGD